ncbi:TPA: hypothetical protein ACX3C9_004669 [Vibrio parahaemolyticus]|uniref:hypothetical protein n=1 Tax=Vibrio harveyi group TaxID=717610 RepID=UPI0011223ADF|nr:MULTISPECIES: hypothetical protein [Vibrio harveyi group]MEA5248199.1 hypothetical protein [Vibrio parahaemolyticus]QIR97563.1 hypothetical protein FR741_07320 [Vibrio diabolicus]TOH10286.1 hypothetical protein CGI87_26495 [Vibrio parahaemolyticus]
MNMYIGPEDLKILFNDVVKRCSRELNIQDVDWKSSGELLTEISNINKNVFDKIQDFFSHYQHWYDVHVEIAKTGNQGKLIPEQNHELVNAINNRDLYRKNLLDALSEL